MFGADILIRYGVVAAVGGGLFFAFKHHEQSKGAAHMAAKVERNNDKVQKAAKRAGDRSLDDKSGGVRDPHSVK